MPINGTSSAHFPHREVDTQRQIEGLAGSTLTAAQSALSLERCVVSTLKLVDAAPEKVAGRVCFLVVWWVCESG